MLNQSIDNDVSWKSPFGLKVNLRWPPLILTRSCSPGQFVKPGQCTIRFALTTQPSISGAFMGCCSGSVCWRAVGATTPLWTVDLRPLPPPGSLPPNPPCPGGGRVSLGRGGEEGQCIHTVWRRTHFGHSVCIQELKTRVHFSQKT